MAKIDAGRLIASVIVAGVFYFIADGIIHGAILGRDYKAAITEAGKPLKDDPTSYAYFAVFDLGKALVALLVYVAARSRFGAGPKTAMWAGVVTWLAVETLPAIAAMPFPFFSRVFYCKVIALELVPTVLGAILGAWIYREA